MIRNKNSPSLDGECVLLTESITFDEVGNELAVYEEQLVFCGELPIYQSEFFAAAQQDIKVETLLVVSSYDYGGQKKVRYSGAVFDVYRIYGRPDGLTELYLK